MEAWPSVLVRRQQVLDLGSGGSFPLSLQLTFHSMTRAGGPVVRLGQFPISLDQQCQGMHDTMCSNGRTSPSKGKTDQHSQAVGRGTPGLDWGLDAFSQYPALGSMATLTDQTIAHAREVT